MTTVFDQYPYPTMPLMWTNYLKVLLDTLEGNALTNTKDDKGGVTKFGITQPLLDDFHELPDTAHLVIPCPKLVKDLYKGNAVQIYSAMFYNVWCNRLGTRIRASELIFTIDVAINHGPVWATLMWQTMNNRFSKRGTVIADGVWGPKTEIAVENYLASNGSVSVLPALIEWRISRYIEICQGDPSQLKFLVGWYVRAASWGDR